jgi:hypothetical protein
MNNSYYNNKAIKKIKKEKERKGKKVAFSV